MSFFAKINAKQQMGIAALIMGLSVLLSRFMGLFRDKVISWQFGASGETDLYFSAFVIPDFLNHLLAGAYVSITLIPILSKLMEQDQEDAWKFFSSVLLWASSLVLGLTIFLWIFAPLFAPILAPGFTEEQIQRLVTFLRIILPAQVCFIPGACFAALLYIRKKFTIPALMPLIYNGMILLCGVLFPYLGIAQGMEGFCWGVFFGAFLGAFYLPYLAAKSDGITFYFVWKHTKLKHLLFLAFPLILGQSIVVLDEQFIRIFGSLAGTGEVSLLSYSRRIMMVPVGVVAQAAGVASFPFLAQLFAKNDFEAFNATLNNALKNTLVIVLPISLYLISVANPVLGLIFEGGQFNQSDTILASPYLQIMLIAVPFWAFQQILGRAFYAMENTKTPAIVGTIITLITIPIYAYFVPIFGGISIAIITTASIGTYALVMFFVGRKKFLNAYKGLLCLFGKNMLLNTLPFILCVSISFWLPKMFISHFSMLLTQFLQIGLSGIIYLISYFILAKIFMPQNITLILSPFLKRLKK